MVAKIDHGTAAAQQNAAAAQQNAAVPQLNCPRCDSTNTKFCYYNNYSLTQPRHFCKSCKRYWTRGGTLRNVPVGGGCRKNKRAKKPHRSAAADAPAAAPSLPPPPVTDLSSFIYGLPLMNSKPAFYPKLELDAQLAEYEENFKSCLDASNLSDLQYSLLNCQIPSSSSTESYQPLLSYDDLTIANNTSNRSIQWQFSKENPLDALNSSFAGATGAGEVAESSYLHWNQAVSGGWPESGSSLAPLI